MQVDVTYASGETVRVTVPPKARRNFEREFETPLATRMASGFSDWLDYLAHQALVLRHNEGRDIEAWMDDVDQIALVLEADDDDADAEADDETPTGGATTPQPESSPS